MALHPFNSFRRYQRVIFAALTIVCMLTFVVSSGVQGMGDGINWLQNKLTGRSRYQPAAKLFGKSVDVHEMALLREQRILANRYMLAAILRSYDLIVQDVVAIIPGLDAQIQMQVKRIVQSREAAFDPRYAQLASYFQQQYMRESPQYAYPLLILEETLTKANKTVEAGKIRLLRMVIRGDEYLLQNANTPGGPKDDLYPASDLYFGGAITTDGLLDFKIWQNEADRLGIYLNEEDVARAIHEETLGRLTNDDALAIEKALTPRGQPRVNPIPAVGEEIRVRLAQTTLLGFDPGGIMKVPAPVTPAELWNYYKTNRIELAVKFLPIPVSKFIDQVKDKPTDAELTKLFDEYKNAENSPFRNTPSFKQLRRIKLEWIGAKSDSPRYRKEARKWIMSALASTPGNPWMAMALLDPVVTEYNRVTTRFGDGSLKVAAWSEAGFALSFETYAHWQRAESAAAFIGQLAGASLDGNPLSAFMASQAAAHARESKTQESAIAAEASSRAPMCASLVLAGTAPSQVLVMSGIWQVLEAKEFNLPMEAVKNRLISRLEADLSRDILTNSLTAFRKEMDATKGKAAEAEKVIDKFVKEGGWEHGASATFDDMFNLAKDPKLAKLKEAYDLDNLTTDPKGKYFSYQFFPDLGRAQPKLFAPEQMQSRSDDTNFLFWRTADEPAKALTFEEAKPAVETAWRFQKARELAKKEAEKIAKQSPSDPVPALLDAAKKLNETPFDLFGVAYLKKSLQSRPAIGGGSDFEPYRPPEDKIEYPQFDFITKLMDPGTVKSAVVLADQPENIEYVAVVINRVVPEIRDFQMDTSPVIRQNQMLAAMEQDKRLAYRFGVMKQLREKAGLQILEVPANAPDRQSAVPTRIISVGAADAEAHIEREALPASILAGACLSDFLSLGEPE